MIVTVFARYHSANAASIDALASSETDNHNFVHLSVTTLK
jgi:hypothetical protein